MGFKRTAASLLLLIASLGLIAQQDVNGNFMHAGSNRTYIIHEPQFPDTPAALIIGLHGLGDQASNVANFSGFSEIGDTAGFYVVYAQALVDPILTGTAWNNGLNPFATTDDMGFLSRLIDTMLASYPIDTGRVYFTGFSMGGFMCHRIACELSERVTAIASFAGMLPKVYDDTAACNPALSIPIAHFHGTADNTVPYDGSGALSFVVTSVDRTIEFWTGHHNCPSNPLIDTLPDLATDGYRVWTTRYDSCDRNSEVLLYTIDGADHIWMTPQNDISYSHEAWKFFQRHQRNAAPLDTAGSTDSTVSTAIVPVEALPFYARLQNGLLQLENGSTDKVDFRLTDLNGKLIASGRIGSGQHRRIRMQRHAGGIYLLRAWNQRQAEEKRLWIY